MTQKRRATTSTNLISGAQLDLILTWPSTRRSSHEPVQQTLQLPTTKPSWRCSQRMHSHSQAVHATVCKPHSVTVTLADVACGIM